MSAAGLVVLGASIAGATAAQAARDVGWEGAITLVDPEPSAYLRPPLSKGVLTGAESLDDIGVPDPPDVRMRRGRRVAALHSDARRVELDDGECVPFDALVVATGARARAFGVSGEHTVRDREDVHRLSSALRTAEQVAVVGGGLLAAEVASSIAMLGHAVLLAARRPPLREALGLFLSDAICRAAEEHGARLVVHPGLGVFEHEGAAVVTAGGDTFRPSLLVSAIGDEPNTRWCVQDGAPLNVDASLRASERMWGAGDAVVVGGGPRTPHWQAAIEQGRTAGRNAGRWLLGLEPDEVHVPERYLWTEAFGLKLKIAGASPGDESPSVVAGDWNERSAVLHWRGREAGSAVSVNHRMPVPRLRALARTESPTTDASKEMP
ncbi:NAD(P)/FAD-dependent oxidoreductase [Microbacterium sp. Clip185]|uniref:NAD(P)/FAD-dependent oxidoreductase n=1 Tax=Microbacterium sp. Clip185 TaxID=3025663 RepID=UPI00236740C8|nr:NAD(P)/FAD-dependent oxidoreductase [Microbacterium sp. Clip185]WDG18397.1 NAD(P)/FAD-dependent oxidoreductase [Microbacterium sp. Clip185]